MQAIDWNIANRLKYFVTKNDRQKAKIREFDMSEAWMEQQLNSFN